METIQISKDRAVKQSRLALRQRRTAKKKAKSLADFYGKLPNAFGNGAAYQKAVRNEWQ